VHYTARARLRLRLHTAPFCAPLLYVRYYAWTYWFVAHALRSAFVRFTRTLCVADFNAIAALRFARAHCAFSTQLYDSTTCSVARCAHFVCSITRILTFGCSMHCRSYAVYAYPLQFSCARLRTFCTAFALPSAGPCTYTPFTIYPLHGYARRYPATHACGYASALHARRTRAHCRQLLVCRLRFVPHFAFVLRSGWFTLDYSGYACAHRYPTPFLRCLHLPVACARR